MSCVHHFTGNASCEHCSEPAIAFLEKEVRRLDAAARAALGYTISGERTKAEAELRKATQATPLFGMPLSGGEE